MEANIKEFDCETLMLTRLYGFGLKSTYIMRPDAQFFIVLEDHMIVHDGFFKLVTNSSFTIFLSDYFVFSLQDYYR